MKGLNFLKDGLSGESPFSGLKTSFLGFDAKVTGLSTIFSAVAFVVLKFLNIVAAYPGIILIICIVGVFSSFIFFTRKDKARWFLLSVSVVMLLLLAWFGRRNRIAEQKASESELLADATDAGVSWFTDPSLFRYVHDSLSWFIPAVQNDEMVYVLVPSKISPQAVGRNAMDFRRHQKDSLDKEMWMIYTYQKVIAQTLQGEYNLVGIYKPHMKDGYEFKRCKLLPESVAITIKGAALLKTDVLAAKRLFEKADSMNNPAATQQIALMYSDGIGMTPDREIAKKVAKRAAIGGSRMARLLYGRLVLLDSTYSNYDKTVAEEMLKRATVINTVASPAAHNYAQYANDMLSQYYWSTRRYEDAYKVTKSSIEAYPNPDVLYYNHFYNCIFTNRIDEAKSLIEEGKKEGNPNAYAMHAEMICRGLGYEKDYIQAESLNFKAIETAFKLNRPLNDFFPNMFRSMESLFEDAADSTGAAFWGRLADINYNIRVDDE